MFVISQDREIDEEIELLVLATDGLWDVVPNEVNLFLTCAWLQLIIHPSIRHAFDIVFEQVLRIKLLFRTFEFVKGKKNRRDKTISYKPC